VDRGLTGTRKRRLRVNRASVCYRLDGSGIADGRGGSGQIARRGIAASGLLIHRHAMDLITPFGGTVPLARDRSPGQSRGAVVPAAGYSVGG